MPSGEYIPEQQAEPLCAGSRLCRVRTLQRLGIGGTTRLPVPAKALAVKPGQTEVVPRFSRPLPTFVWQRAFFAFCPKQTIGGNTQ